MTLPTATTGRYLVLIEPGATEAAAGVLRRTAGVRVASTADAAVAVAGVNPNPVAGVVLHDLGVAVVAADPDQAAGLARAVAEPGPVLAVEPERVVRAIATPAPAPAPPAPDEDGLTWGLRAIGAAGSTATGVGVRVAVLDTGIDLRHPDFAGRGVVARSFVPGEEAQDGHGHGTHCTGTACGPRNPSSGPRYGVATGAEVYVGKVLGDGGSGTDGGILAGIAWAVAAGCRVVSMSLGAATEPGQPHSEVFERTARRAAGLGTLIVAAAGNESERPGRTAPVGHPANCPSILAVGAVDVDGRTAGFSCGSVDPGGQVDVVGPGVDVLSSWPLPETYKSISGTSMATPHVAGVAALLAERYPDAGPWELWARLSQFARRLDEPSVDVGAGLVQAP